MSTAIGEAAVDFVEHVTTAWRCNRCGVLWEGHSTGHRCTSEAPTESDLDRARAWFNAHADGEGPSYGDLASLLAEVRAEERGQRTNEAPALKKGDCVREKAYPCEVGVVKQVSDNGYVAVETITGWSNAPADSYVKMVEEQRADKPLLETKFSLHDPDVLIAVRTAAERGEGPLTLILQLLGVPPCSACGFIKSGCRCSETALNQGGNG